MLSVPSCRVLFQLHVMSALPAPVVPGVQPVEFFSAPLFRDETKYPASIFPFVLQSRLHGKENYLTASFISIAVDE